MNKQLKVICGVKFKNRVETVIDLYSKDKEVESIAPGFVMIKFKCPILYLIKCIHNIKLINKKGIIVRA